MAPRIHPWLAGFIHLSRRLDCKIYASQNHDTSAIPTTLPQRHSAFHKQPHQSDTFEQTNCDEQISHILLYGKAFSFTLLIHIWPSFKEKQDTISTLDLQFVCVHAYIYIEYIYIYMDVEMIMTKGKVRKKGLLEILLILLSIYNTECFSHWQHLVI